MPRKFIILTTLVLIIGALGFVFLRDKEIFSSLPSLNLANLFSSSPDPMPAVSEEAQHPGYVINIPEGFKTTSNSEEGISVDTYEKNEKEGFQVFVMPFDEPGPITPERILLDIDIEISNPQYILVDGVEALAFNSKDEGFGNTFDVWLVRDTKLYQITTYKNFREKLLEILQTWRFQ